MYRNFLSNSPIFTVRLFLSWSLIYKQNFSPHRLVIWNIKDILFKRRKQFLDSWFNHNIILVDQLFDNAGTLSYEGFLSKCNLAFAYSSGEYAKVFGAISAEIRMLFRQRPKLFSISYSDSYELSCWKNLSYLAYS
ncbi:hypothetical protein ILYODFUR_039133 [Ilyodon furcidens]|uniref:Uncharacterized protein n=1 Tax=Ilyodon furcidens TaxID=33524 RepID=A0ABV0VNE7_9TELE